MLPALTLLLIVLAAVWLFFAPPAWFPLAITPAALAYDRQFHWTLWITGGLFLAAQLLIVWLILRRSSSGMVAAKSTAVRISWMTAAAMLAVEVLLAAHSGGSISDRTAARPETIEVHAHQFAWNFRYPGPDGVFGRTGNAFIADAGGNPVGIDPGDSRGKDDVVTASLRIPAGRDVRLLLRSRDVIHDFFVRELRTKQDIVPGMTIPLDIHADRIGQYEIACAELCGLSHNQMHSILTVMPAAEYDQWKLSH